MPERKKTLMEKFSNFFSDASLSCSFNTARALWDGRVGSLTPAHPWLLQVEVSNRCNLSCVFCGHHYESEMQLGDLNPDLYDEVVRLSKTTQEVVLFGYGEPLMAKAFWELLPRLESSHVAFFTNGMLMTEKKFREIVATAKPKLSYISFSVDAGKAETFESIRCNAKHAKVWEHLRMVSHLRKELCPELNLRIEFVAMKKNIHELPLLIEQAEEADIDVIKVSHLVVWREELKDQSLFTNQELCKEAFATAREACKGKRVQVDFPKVFGETPYEGNNKPHCRMPWNYAMISYEGDVRACCFAPAELTMGNLHNASFEEIWHSEKYQNLRKSLTGGIPDYSVCDACEERYRYQSSPDENATYLKLKPRKK